MLVVGQCICVLGYSWLLSSLLPVSVPLSEVPVQLKPRSDLMSPELLLKSSSSKTAQILSHEVTFGKLD